MFIDDDVYMCPGWDAMLDKAATAFPDAIISGHAHPYNHSIANYSKDDADVEAAAVISTVHMLMPWALWDDVGFFIEPGGAGGGEDVDYCRRAIVKDYGLVITRPHCVIHCGLTSSNGNQIVGYDLMVEQNQKLIEHYALKGVLFK